MNPVMFTFPYSRYLSVTLPQIQPSGWIKEFMKRQCAASLGTRKPAVIHLIIRSGATGLNHQMFQMRVWCGGLMSRPPTTWMVHSKPASWRVTRQSIVWLWPRSTKLSRTQLPMASSARRCFAPTIAGPILCSSVLFCPSTPSLAIGFTWMRWYAITTAPPTPRAGFHSLGDAAHGHENQIVCFVCQVRTRTF